MDIKKIIQGLITLCVAISLIYGFKHFVHKKCVLGALEMRCNSASQRIVDVEVPWWNPISDGYPCYATLKKVLDDGQEREMKVSFLAKRVSSVDLVVDSAKFAQGEEGSDDWDVNMGFWGWIGDDYHIRDLKVL